jgi:hypothetical protein
MWIRAKDYLTEAVASARRTGQQDVVFRAEELLPEIGKHLV